MLLLAWPSTEPDLNILYWGLLNNVLRTIVELSHKNRTLHNIRDADHFVFRRAWSGPSVKPSNQQLVLRRRSSQLAASTLKSPSLIDHCFRSTIQTIHVPLLPKAVGFTIEEFLTTVFQNLPRESVLYWNSSYDSKVCCKKFTKCHYRILTAFSSSNTSWSLINLDKWLVGLDCRPFQTLRSNFISY